MANFYLTPWRGTGTLDDPFVPNITAVAPWYLIDLRPDPSVVTGWAFVSSAAAASGLLSTVVSLGTDTFAALSGNVRGKVRTNLGLASLAATTFPAIAAEVLTTHATEDGTRWRPVRPVRAMTGGTPVQRYEIHLGGLLWSREEPV